jgi:hypothetical protein
VWDGFVDETGRFNVQGPDFEGQTRRLRTGDGVYFTKAGARKLAHYLEREIRRVMTPGSEPIALPPSDPQLPSAAFLRRLRDCRTCRCPTGCSCERDAHRHQQRMNVSVPSESSRLAVHR